MKAVILAAGRGTRMGELTEALPKPMIELRGKPILEHILDRLRLAGCDRALVVTGYRADVIESHFAGYPLAIEFQRQETVDGTARAALLARDFAGAEPFLLTYGDILTETADYRQMFRKADGASAVLAVKWVDDPWQGAAVYERDGRVVEIIEKPARGTSTTHWNSAGSYVFGPEIFAELACVPRSIRGEYEITSGIEQLIRGGRLVRMHALQGGWRDVGRPDDISEAEKLVG